MQVLTVEGVKEAARDYYRRGRLTAQHPTKPRCVYRDQHDHDFRCAIGASFNDETMAKVVADNLGGNIYALRNKVVTYRDDAAVMIEKIQGAHDQWARRRDDVLVDGRAFGTARIGFTAMYEKARDQFLALIDYKDETPSG